MSSDELSPLTATPESLSDLFSRLRFTFSVGFQPVEGW